MLLVPRNHPHLLHPDNTLLVIMDMQEPFLRNIYERDRVLRNISILARSADILRVPIITTTQYGEKMGGVVSELASHIPSLSPKFDKISFSCYADPAFASAVQRSGRKQILLCGVESHICISQTAHELAASGFQPHVVTDAVSSRTEANWRLGLDKMRQGGVILASVESAIYELLHEAGSPEFQKILALIK